MNKPTKVTASLTEEAKMLIPYTGTSGFYSSRVPISSSSLDLLHLMSDLADVSGLELETIDELHCTVMYSPDKVPSSLIVDRSFQTTWVIGASIFGTALVLRLFCTSQMLKRFRVWTDLGCEYTWPDYQPHITIAKIVEPDGKENLVTELDAYLKAHPIPIVLGGETVEDVRQ